MAPLLRPRRVGRVRCRCCVAMSSHISGRAAVPIEAACATLGGAAGLDCSRRARNWVAIVILVIAAGTAAMTPAHAQGYAQPNGLGGFMQGLFGGPAQQPQYPQNPPLQLPPPGASLQYPQSLSPRSLVPGRTIERSSGPTKPQSEQPASGRKQPHANASASLGGGLRTMCVRLCDGYYWPMTFDARRSRMDHDSKVCAASCSSEARAFVMPKSGEAKDMVDAQGRPYLKLANAFKYRKAAAGTCSCRPDPWDDEARARHDGFAEKSAMAATKQADATDDSATVLVTKKDEARPREQTIADAEALILSGGMVAAGSGLPASAVVAQADPAGAAKPAAALDDEGKPQPEKSGKTLRVASRSSKNPEPQGGANRNKPRPDRQPWIIARPMTPAMPYPPARIIVPAGYGRQPAAAYGRQPYVIGQPQVVPYRTY